MKKLSAVLLIATLALLGGFAGGKFSAPAQTTTFNVQVATGTTESNCTVVTAATIYCFTGGGVIYVSVNGAAYVPYTSGVVAGVSSISVNGGTALTGPVALTIPTTATTTVTSTASTTIH